MSAEESFSVEERFQSLLDEHYATLYGYASYITLGQSDAEDLVHEAFLAAFARLKEGRDFEGNPLHWLRAVVRNQCRSRWRHNRRMLPATAEILGGLVQDVERPLDELIRDEAETTLHGCLDKLPNGERKMMADRYTEGCAVQAMAAAEEMNEKTFRVRLYRIRQKLKACLEKTLPDWCG